MDKKLIKNRGTTYLKNEIKKMESEGSDVFIANSGMKQKVAEQKHKEGVE